MNADGEREFREFVVGASAGLQRLAYLMTGDRGEAEDVVQAALTQVYLAWPRIEKRGAVGAYSRKVLVREVLSGRRRRRVQLVLSATLPQPAGSDQLAQVDDRDAMQQALLQLPARQRAVVVLRYYDDLSETQTAAALGITTGAVKTHASRGLGRLREVLAAATNEEQRM
jgi:RNA polymerase sigma-70 factor (ECF subfamily)